MIRDFLVRHAVAELWQIIWHFGIIGLVAIAGLAWTWFSPFYKKTGLWVAACSVIIGITAGIYTKLGADYVRAKWEAAEAAAIKIGEEARDGAVADIKRSGSSGLSNDPNNRDNDKGAMRPVAKDQILGKERHNRDGGRSAHPQ